MVMVKDKQEPIKYTGPAKKDPIVGWVYAKHFNYLVSWLSRSCSLLGVSGATAL